MATTWAALCYTEEEFHQLYEQSSGFNDDINRNRPSREKDETFESFMDDGSTELIKNSPNIVRHLR